MLNRNKSIIWLTKRDRTFTGDYSKFLPAIEIRVNFVIANSRADLVAFGENYVNFRKSNINTNGPILIEETDRVYETEPESFDPLANKADYTVISVAPIINDTVVTYEKLSGKNAN